MMITLNRLIGIALLGSSFLFVGCDSTLNLNKEEIESSSVGNLPMELQPAGTLEPTAANDGLDNVNLEGVSATGFVTAGTGTASRQAEPISVEVPAGATVKEVYLYWARLGNDIDNEPRAPSTILVNSSEVTGSVIGYGAVDNPDQFLPSQYRAGITHRANLTGLGLISAGMNTFTVQDNPATPDYPAQPLGASVIVFYSEPDKNADVLLFEGSDYLWANSGGNTLPQRLALTYARPVTFTFDAVTIARRAYLTLFIGDVEPEDASERPNSLKITLGDNPTQVIGPDASPFQGFQGPEWDNYNLSLTIPAGVDQVTVEPVSGPGTNAASLLWSFAGLTISVPQAEGGEGCTPGFWRQSQHYKYWTKYSPYDILSGVFDVPNSLRLRRPESGKATNIQLKHAVQLRGGDVNALIRHAVAALLNAASSEINYNLTVNEVISKFNAAVRGGDINATKNEFERFNELGCSIKDNDRWEKDDKKRDDRSRKNKFDNKDKNDKTNKDREKKNRGGKNH